METIAHLSSEHWWVSLLYFTPVLVVVVGIGVSALRTRGGTPRTTNEHEQQQEDSDDA